MGMYIASQIHAQINILTKYEGAVY